MTDFAQLGLCGPILKALAEAGHSTPTPIQAKAIPVVLEGRDLVGIAQTGTGKTAAFALPILDRLAAEPKRVGERAVRILVLSPTRELASQILASFRTYGKHLRVRSALAIGGVPIGGQRRALERGTDILVATPGRLIDLLDQRAVRLDEIEVLVLDEADRMLDMGFIPAIRKIVARLPKARRNLFFSATMPPEIADLAKGLLKDPVRVAVTPIASTAEKVEQRVIFVDGGAKAPLLASVLREPEVGRALVFTRTKRGADRVVKGLDAAGIDAAAIHGNKSQGQRERALAAFRDGSSRVLVATDIAARGIDVPGVTHVVNFDLPNDTESYVHRIGRTARAGAAGKAISFCGGAERPMLRAIEKLIGQAIPVEGGDPAPERPPMRAPRPAQAGPRNPGSGMRQENAPAAARRRRRRRSGPTAELRTA